jgi:assimilatory nitrate reductase catalytic subunit
MSVRGTCPYCGVGCGVAAAGAREAAEVAGDAQHPANFGKLCSKGTALAETLGLDGRLLYPMIGGERADWNDAISLIARRFGETIAEHGPDSVAFYVSGQILSEDYYVANKLMKGFIGSGNIDTNSRLCMASAVAAHKLAFGEDVVPGCYEDLDLAKLIVFTGHNAAWTHPVLYRRMEAARAQGQRHIVIDPRETDTSRGADLHLKLKSQTDVRLWNGLLAHLDAAGVVDARYVAKHTNGFDAVLNALRADDQSAAAIAADCGLSSADVSAFYAEFAATPETVTLFSMGANQSIDGVAKGLAVINAHLATGRIGKPGAAPFSITGQPNAMGGRETGGMANTLAAHLDFTFGDIDIVRRFWDAPNLTQKLGFKAVEMFDAVADGRIKAIWIMATNPVVSMPNADVVRAALAACPFVIVSDVVERTDTMRYAHVRLPALAWGEKEGTVTNSERRISRQRAFLAPPGEARADWRALRDVARAMGFSAAFRFGSTADVFREHAALTRFENNGSRVLNLGTLADLDDAAFDALEPTQWPVDENGQAEARLFANGGFSTPDGKAQFHLPVSAPRFFPADLPLVLNTGRIRDQWHTMTRTGLSPRLMRHAPEPYVEIHPADAEHFSIVDGALARVSTAYGEGVFAARITEAVRMNEIFAPMHWTSEFAPQARANALVAPLYDERSGQPEFKRTPARIAPAEIAWRGFLVSRDLVDLPPALWWRRIPQEHGHLYEIAAPAEALGPQALSIALFRDCAADELLSAGDASGGFVRTAAIRGERLQRALFATRGRGLPQRDWLAQKLADEVLSEDDRRIVLAGGQIGAPRGACVCACFNVSRTEIESFARQAPGAGVALVGEHLKAGTNCGSCRPEIAQILEACGRKTDAAA